MRRSRRILFNVGSNIVLHGIGVGVSFFMVPLLLRYFGKEVFGLNAYVAGIVVLFTFVSSAISMSLIKFVPESLAAGDYETLGRYLSATFSFSALVNIPAGILIAGFPYYGASLFDMPPELALLARPVFAVVGAGVALQFFLPVINGVYYGLEMFALRNGIQLISVALNVFAYFIVASRGGTLVHYVVIVQSGIIITMVVAGVVLLRRLPFPLKLSVPGLALVRRTLGMNLFLVANQAAHSLLYSADKLILQKLFGTVSVAEYQIARQTDQMMQGVISLPLSAIMPSIARAYASGDGAYVRKMNATGAYLYCALMVPPLVMLFCIYDAFIFLWVGGGFDRAILAGRLFVVAVVVATPLKVFSHSLVANGQVKLLGVAKVSYALLNVPLSILCALRFGFIGVVIPTVGYWLVCHPVLILYLASKEGLSRSIIVNICMVLALLPLAWLSKGLLPFDPSASWLFFVFYGGLLYLVVLFAYILGVAVFTPTIGELRQLILRMRGQL